MTLVTEVIMTDAYMDIVTFKQPVCQNTLRHARALAKELYFTGQFTTSTVLKDIY